MRSGFVHHIRTHGVAYLALFVALSGTAWAATTLPRNSVGTKQLRKHAVTGGKVRANTLTGKQIKESSLGQVPLARRASIAKQAQDSERFDGIDSAVLGSAEIFAGMDFEPRDSTATKKAYQGTGAISCTGTALDFTERLQLPQGARITSLDYAFLDDDSGSNSSLEIRAYDTLGLGGPVTVPIVSVGSNNNDSADHTVSAAPTGTVIVDNARYAYQLNWTPAICDPDSQLVGAAVHYSLPTG